VDDREAQQDKQNQNLQLPGVCSIFICNDSGNSGGGATGQQKHSKEHIWVTATC
jgi:hypothetical protein